MMETAVRFFVLMKYCSIAETARRDGIATWFSSTPRSDRMRIFAPSLYALSHSTKAVSYTHLSWQFDPEIMQMITNGNIAYELARPVDIYSLWFVRGLSTRLSKTALRCLPILVIAFLLPQPYGLTLPPSFINALIFVFSMALAAICVGSYTMIVYIMCCHTVNSMGVKIIMQNLVDFLSGGLVPLMFMPNGLRKVLEYSPFGAMENLSLIHI